MQTFDIEFSLLGKTKDEYSNLNVILGGHLMQTDEGYMFRRKSKDNNRLKNWCLVNKVH